MTKEEIAQNVQFLLLTQCFPLLVIGYPFNYRDFLFFLTKYVNSRLLQNCRMRERVKQLVWFFTGGTGFNTTDLSWRGSKLVAQTSKRLVQVGLALY